MQGSLQYPDPTFISGTTYIDGDACGEVLYTETPLSFWGGIDPQTGKVIDSHHPLSGQTISGKIFVLPSGRGSCTGSSIVLELLLNGKAPAALILSETDSILLAGVLVAKIFFGRSLPVMVVQKSKFQRIAAMERVKLCHNGLMAAGEADEEIVHPEELSLTEFPSLDLTSYDQELLSGKHGEAARLAMTVICKMAVFQNAKSLINVQQAHIDACIYTGKGALAFSEKLKMLDVRVAVPTTLNAISIDLQNRSRQPVPEKIALPAKRLAENYLAIGAEESFTCAPYLLCSAPLKGQEIGWAESNAVVFANSIIGAHSQKNPDFMDACIAITGRAPKTGCHLKANRMPTIRIIVEKPDVIDDSFYPLLGYRIGLISGSHIPLINGLSGLHPNRDNLKAMSAAFATTSAAPMFHIEGITAEISDNRDWLDLDLETFRIGRRELLEAWHVLNGNAGNRNVNNAPAFDKIDLVALGNSHFSLEEALLLAKLCQNKTRSHNTGLYITMGRHCLSELEKHHSFQSLQDFGATIITDTCWCMIGAPIIKNSHKTILTNSGKYAHYGAGLTKCTMRFAGLANCVQAAVEGKFEVKPPYWLTAHENESKSHVQL